MNVNGLTIATTYGDRNKHGTSGGHQRTQSGCRHSLGALGGGHGRLRLLESNRRDGRSKEVGACIPKRVSIQGRRIVLERIPQRRLRQDTERT